MLKLRFAKARICDASLGTTLELAYVSHFPSFCAVQFHTTNHILSFKLNPNNAQYENAKSILLRKKLIQGEE